MMRLRVQATATALFIAGTAHGETPGAYIGEGASTRRRRAPLSWMPAEPSQAS